MSLKDPHRLSMGGFFVALRPLRMTAFFGSA